MSKETILFDKFDGTLGDMFSYIEMGDLGLPDLQRPFVWGTSKVRDLFDSIYRGYPIGSFLIWRNAIANKMHQIGMEERANEEPSILIIDGQQRLTALYAVFRKKSIKNDNYQTIYIVIAFNPLTEEFRVADASTIRNREFINDISDLFIRTDSRTFINEYLSTLKAHKESVKEKRQKLIDKLSDQDDLRKGDIELIIDHFEKMKELNDVQLTVLDKLKHYEDEDNESLLPQEIEIVKENLKKDEIIDENIISARIEKLYGLKNYPFYSAQIKPIVSEEVIAEIFTRINSRGTPLNQTDFILTLLSVFWDDGRKTIDTFCESCKNNPQNEKVSPFNYIFRPMPNHIIKIVAGVGFNRAKMQDIYSLLTGRDFATKKTSTELREKQLTVFKDTQQQVLDNTSWHGFLKILMGVGFKSEDLIKSINNVVNSYTLYLIGKLKYKMDHRALEGIIGKWFFFSSLTSRYSFSPESQMDSDLGIIKEAKSSTEFINELERIISNTLTNDFWNITLPNELLVSSSSNSPARKIYFACLIRNNFNVLFSNRTVNELFNPEMKLKRSALEKHHIFPKEYLKTLNLDRKKRNQTANFTYLEYEDNVDISDDPPEKYVLDIKNKYYKDKTDAFNKTLSEHCLPPEFYKMDYETFLLQRRKLMAEMIRRTYENM